MTINIENLFWIDIERFEEFEKVEDGRLYVNSIELNGSKFEELTDNLIVGMMLPLGDNSEMTPVIYHPGRGVSFWSRARATQTIVSIISIFKEVITNPTGSKPGRLFFWIRVPAPLAVAATAASMIYSLAEASRLYFDKPPLEEGYYDMRSKDYSRLVFKGKLILTDLEDLS